MRILVDHGACGNLGDSSMVEGVVLRLFDLLPGEEIFVIDRPNLRTKIFWFAKCFQAGRLFGEGNVGRRLNRCSISMALQSTLEENSFSGYTGIPREFNISEWVSSRR